MRYRLLLYTIAIIGLFGLLDTIILITFTNIDIGILLPGAAGILFITYALLKVKIYRSKPLIKNRLIRVFAAAVIIVFILSFVFVEGLIISNSGPSVNTESEYIIILGAGLREDTVSLTLKKRLDLGISYLNSHPDTKVLVSGGQGPGEIITEAEAMKRYLISHGIEQNRIVIEDRSTSTMENFIYSKEKLLQLEGREVKNILIITNDFHMMRAKMLAARNGFEPSGVACSTPITVRLNCYIREYFAFVKSFFLDTNT